MTETYAEKVHEILEEIALNPKLTDRGIIKLNRLFNEASNDADKTVAILAIKLVEYVR